MRIALSLLACFLSLTLAAPDLARAQSSPTVTKTAQLHPDGEVSLDTFSGRVEVMTWDRSSVQVEARIEDGDRELVERTQILVEGSGDRVEIADEVEDDGGGGFFSRIFGGGESDHPSVHYRLRVPRRARLVLETFSSDVRAQDLGGDLVLDGYSGDVEIDGLRGRLEAEMFSGDLRVRGLDGSATVETYSGDVELAVQRLTGDSSFESFSGDVTLRLPARAGFRLIADLGMSGDFESDFPTDASAVEDGAYRGTVGGGPHHRVTFDTFSGDLRLMQQ